MVHIRRVGLVIATATLAALIVAAFLTEGFGLAVIVIAAAVIAAGLVIPFFAIFEEERDLPFARAERSRRELLRQARRR